MVLGFGGRSYKRPLVKNGPWWFWSVGRAPWSKRPPGGFGVWGGGVQEPLVKFAGGPWSKGPLMVLEARARPLVKKGPWWSWGLEARARPLVKKNPWWFWGLGGSPWSKRAPGGFGVWDGVLQEAPGQKGHLVVLGFGAGSSKRPLVKKGPWWFWRLGRAP